MDPEPDPAFHVNPDTDLDPDPIWTKGFEDKNRKKKIQMKTFLDQKSNLLMSKLQEKLSALKREHPALKIMKFISF